MARLRSPNFPGLSLEEAVEAAREIFDKSRHAVIPREVVAKDLGYTGLTGRSVVILGALNQYGLVENASKGQMKVSQLAADILHGYPESVRLEALYKAGREPSLFKAIFDKFDNHVPSDNAVRSFLIQSGFTNEGAEKALKTFSETNRFLAVKGACESYGNEAEAGRESSPEPTAQDTKIMENVGQIQPSDPLVNALRGRSPLDFQLSMNGLEVTGRTRSRSELERFIATLQTILPLIPEDDGGVTH